MFWMRNKNNNFQLHTLIWRLYIEITRYQLPTSFFFYVTKTVVVLMNWDPIHLGFVNVLTEVLKYVVLLNLSTKFKGL